MQPENTHRKRERVRVMGLKMSMQVSGVAPAFEERQGMYVFSVSVNILGDFAVKFKEYFTANNWNF